MSAKVEAFCLLIKVHILRGGSDDDSDFKKYFDEVLKVCQKEPENKKINNHRLSLMEFVEEQKLKNKSREESKFNKFDEEEDYYYSDSS
jgi:hypothetical protein